MRRRLEQYLGMCDRYNAIERASGYDFTDEMRTLNHEAQAFQPTVERILTTLAPRLAVQLLRSAIK